jgi:ABC-type nitrate/sulfonate/bicarbonate transport system substrate-binding protein
VATATGVALETGLFDAEFGDGTVAFRNIKELGRDRMLRSHFDHHLDDAVREGGAVPPIWARSRSRLRARSRSSRRSQAGSMRSSANRLA